MDGELERKRHAVRCLKQGVRVGFVPALWRYGVDSGADSGVDSCVGGVCFLAGTNQRAPHKPTS